MKAPESLETLVEYGIIQEVIRPLMSGKEAQVFVVLAGGEECVAKVYKEANQRTFKHRSDYTEGRRTRNTRDQRAMSKRSQHGRKKDEDAWRSAEVEMIYRLRDAGVRVPEPINFVEGVLVMELVKDADGHAAPRLGDLTFSPNEAREVYQILIREVVRMLCAGVIHGDLSDFNVLMSDQGPVVIDFPQSVDPTHNPNGKKLLLRDVENLHRFLARFAPDEPVLPYGEEIWALFQANRLAPDSKLTGRHQGPVGKADTDEVMALIEDASRDNQRRRGDRDHDDLEELDGPVKAPVTAPASFRRVVDFSGEAKRRPAARKHGEKKGETRPGSRRRTTQGERVPPSGPAAGTAAGETSPTRRRRRRRGGKSVAEPAGETRERAPRGDSLGKDEGKPPGRPKRSRNRRGRSRGEATRQGQSQAQPEEAKADSGSREQSADRGRRGRTGRSPGEARQRGASKTPANAKPTSSKTQAAGERDEGTRPPRRRRRRPRKASSPQ